MSLIATSRLVAIGNALRQIPLPILGNANLAANFLVQKIGRKAPLYGGWVVPAVIGGTWFIWPAVGDETKVSLGLLPDPEVLKAEAEAAAKISALVSAKVLSNRVNGDFSDLHTQWEKTSIASLMMVDDEDEVDEEEEDDDDDDDDEDEDEEE
mmetsp:Transcript_60022/g.70129  ORF Transcript_60022/g.70129 Transcript_60022/m.70129 type:complete len:153 (-) Transcript_60022:68-526(-)|eukprot:CAMPEP_0194357752 /NCGR_PEP_ID=MMETSP0174-20130528/5196_1 /TAXON_ID=216777 /ORGANISM="Proboscia alata, Strain PI-D3" /LENGTH=152 /DNA_ID=CAMNT_0039127907 /DNA_START=89 /DNA_END=547 /DNA_ORIENTATION=+